MGAHGDHGRGPGRRRRLAQDVRLATLGHGTQRVVVVPEMRGDREPVREGREVLGTGERGEVDRRRHAHDLKIWMDVGTLDELLEDNRRMVALLDKRQYNVSYREFSAGHNSTAWRNDVWRGLEEMFPVAPR